MKRQITNYTFNAAAQTITFNDYSVIELDSIIYIENATDNIDIFCPLHGLSGAVSENVLTLNYDTTGMENSDSLLVQYDDTNTPVSSASSIVTVDDFKYATENGQAYGMRFQDMTGILSNTSYYYIIKNTSTTKNIYVHPIDFASTSLTAGSIGTPKDTLQVQIVQNGIFQFGSNVININDYTTSAYSAFKLPTTNLNANYAAQQSALGVWFLTGIAAAQTTSVTWADTATNKVLKTVIADAIRPSTLTKTVRIVPPGAIFVGVLNNFDTTSGAKVAYKVGIEWYEV